MTQEELDKKINQLMTSFDDVQSFFIEKIAAQIVTIGKMTQSSINRIVIMAEMNENIAAISDRLRRAAQISRPELNSIYREALDDVYTDRRFERALTETPMSDNARARIEEWTQNIAAQTGGTMTNLSNTTSVSQTYRQTIDKAVLAVSSGLDDYQSAMRRTVREIGYNGLQVQYESGHRRRLDSAVRQNIIDGVNQIAQQGSLRMGEELNYDAVELSAHMNSAPDHEPVQGRIFLLSEFAKMQNGEPFQDVNGKHYEGFRRPIGEWNCGHIAMSFSTEYSIPRYTERQLQDWAAANNQGCEIGGKHYTNYQARQLMRKIETEVRREKDAANMARAVGDEELRKQCQRRINALARRYSDVAKASGMRMHKERMQVEGFRMVKV